MAEATTPTLPGYRLFTGPFTSPFGTPGYLMYLSDRPVVETAWPSDPPGYELWFAGQNQDAPPRHVLLFRPKKVPLPPPAPPPLPQNAVLVKPGESWVAALKAARPGQTVLLARGGVWTEEGLVDTALRLKNVTLAAWGDGAAPWVRVPGGYGIAAWGWEDITVRGVRFEPDKTTRQAMHFLGCRRVLVDRCEIARHTFGISFEPWGARAGTAGFALRDSHVHDNYNPTGQDGSGVYVGGTAGVTIAGNVFDTNGWADGVTKGDDRDQGCYLAGDNTACFVVGNAFARAASHGLQARAGGHVAGNVFLDNPIHLAVGLVRGAGPITVGGVLAEVSDNLVVGTRPLGGQPRGIGIEASNARQLTIAGNTLALDALPPGKPGVVAAIKMDACQLTKTNPYLGRAMGVGVLDVRDNRVTWPVAPWWVGCKVERQTVQAEWPAADYAAARAEAERRVAELLARVTAGINGEVR